MSVLVMVQMPGGLSEPGDDQTKTTQVSPTARFFYEWSCSMPNQINTPLPNTPLPVDDVNRQLTVVRPDDPSSRSVTINGSISTILLCGDETNQQYCLIDMLIPAGGGAPPHRHDFEEMLTILEGTLLFTFRGQTLTLTAPATINIPSNAPHSFKNGAGDTAHLLCMCTPPGIEDFFLAAADPLASRTSPTPRLNDSERAARGKKAQALAPQFRMEFLP